MPDYLIFVSQTATMHMLDNVDLLAENGTIMETVSEIQTEHFGLVKIEPRLNKNLHWPRGGSSSTNGQTFPSLPPPTNLANEPAIRVFIALSSYTHVHFGTSNGNWKLQKATRTTQKYFLSRDLIIAPFG